LIVLSGRFAVVWRYPLRTSSTVRAVLSADTSTASAMSPSRPVTRLGTTAPTAGSARVYPNCAALNAVYPYGVGRPGAADHTSGTPVTTFVRDAEPTGSTRTGTATTMPSPAISAEAEPRRGLTGVGAPPPRASSSVASTPGAAQRRLHLRAPAHRQ